MADPTKNLCDVVLAVLTLVGAGVAFVLSLLQWRRAQAWQRADKLDTFIEKFESDELLRLATLVVDWELRETKFRGRNLEICNQDALLALRHHDEVPEHSDFGDKQPTIRDAYDALLAFFQRLEVSISNGLIDAEPATAYFAYWLEHFLRFDRHPDEGGKILKGITPEAKVAAYIEAYGDMESIERLCRSFDVEPPSGLEGGPVEASPS
jgi:hypothetical protein